MAQTLLPSAIALLVLAVLLALPSRDRPAAGLVAGFILLLMEPSRDADGARLAGSCTALGVLLLLVAVAALLSGHAQRRHLR